MAHLFRFPDVGEGISEGELVRWMVGEGDDVKIDQPLAEIETDKAVVEMPSPFAGVVLKLHVREKDLIRVGDALITIGERGESVESAAAEAGRPAAPPPARPAAGKAEAAEAVSLSGSALPRVRRLAADLGVDLASVRGSGPQGRITEADVQAAAAVRAEAAPPPAVKIKAKFDLFGDLERVALRGVRRATARRMVQSVTTAAHVTHIDEADGTALLRLKAEFEPRARAENVKLTYLPFIVRAVAAALKLHPYLNSSLDDAAEEIILKKYYNIGIAVDIPDGLIVPVIKFADQKTLLEIGAEIQTLVEAARARTLDLADLKGGTFSITNVGALGGEAATPIINYPETAILGVLRIGERVRAAEGRAVVRTTVPLALSFDHRVIDGAEAARFMNELRSNLEDEGRLRRLSGSP